MLVVLETSGNCHLPSEISSRNRTQQLKPYSVVEEVRHRVARASRKIQSISNFALHIRRQPASLHRSRDHLVSHLDSRGRHNVVRLQVKCLHQGGNRLLTKVAIQAVVHLEVGLSEFVASLSVAIRLSQNSEIPPALRRVTLPDSANNSRLAPALVRSPKLIRPKSNVFNLSKTPPGHSQHDHI